MGFHENEMNRRQGIVKPYKSQFDRTFNEQLLDAVNDNISKRNLYFVFRSPYLTEGLLNVVEFTVTEEISQCFRAVIKLVRHDELITVGASGDNEYDLIDSRASLSIYRDSELERVFSGIVAEFSEKDTGHNSEIYYELVLVPTYYRLGLVNDTRIFQGKTVMDIAWLFLREGCLLYREEHLRKRYPAVEFLMQHNETNLEIMERILAEAGIISYIEHAEEGDTLVFTDCNEGTKKLKDEFIYHINSGGMALECSIRKFSMTTQMTPSTVLLKDYAFKSPKHKAEHKADAADDLSYQRKYQHFDYPGRYKNDETGKRFAQTRIEHLRSNSRVATASSNYSQFSAGHRFEMSEHPKKIFNREWLLVSVQHSGAQSPRMVQTGDVGTTYSNTFSAVPSDLEWKPQPHPKKHINGPQTAVVVGYSGGEIHCDEFGRVYVQFSSDRHEGGSCPLRVVYAAAGAGFGIVSIPRVGQEVIVSFLDGDPDQPIITGLAYNAHNKQPYKLPAAKAKMVIRTQSLNSEGYNELSMEDTQAREEFYMHASKDMNTLVINDQTNHVKHDQHTKVENDLFHEVINNAHYTVEKERRTMINELDHQTIKMRKTVITTNDHLTVQGTAHQAFDEKLLVKVADELHFEVGDKIVAEAGREITLKVGASFIQITGSAINIVSPSVNINGGGVAGIGTPAQALLPLATIPSLSLKSIHEEVSPKNTWIEIGLIYNDLDPVPNAPYRIVFSDGTKQEGSLDDNGLRRLEDVPEGPVEIYFGEDIRGFTMPEQPDIEDDEEQLRKELESYGISMDSSIESFESIMEILSMRGLKK